MKRGAVDDQLCDCVGMIILHSGVWYRYTECLVYNRCIFCGSSQRNTWPTMAITDNLGTFYGVEHGTS